MAGHRSWIRCSRSTFSKAEGRPWWHPATRAESEVLGSLCVHWLDETIQRIVCDEGFALDDLLYELAMLEQKALGNVKHGRLLKL